MSGFKFKVVAAGGEMSMALLSNGTINNWGDLTGITNLTDLTNATAIAVGGDYFLALRSSGMVAAWGGDTFGQIDVPTGLSNVVAIAAGGAHSLALKVDGTVTAWGDNTYGQTNVPAGLSNVMAIAAGDAHSVALRNDGTVVAWGDNSYGQTNVISTLSNVKMIAAGGDFTVAAVYSTWVQYPVSVTNDLLLIYNTNSMDSSNVWWYYMQNRPMVANANVLGIGFPGFNVSGTNYYETISPNDFTNDILAPVKTWLIANPTKRPQYVVLFLNVPSRVNATATASTNYPFYGNGTNVYFSVSYQLATEIVGWQPFITHINMNGTNDCIAYIKKLAQIGTNNSLIISASVGEYGNTNYYFDDALGLDSYGLGALEGVTNSGVSLSAVDYDPLTSTNHIGQGTNVAGYFTWGENGNQGSLYALDGIVGFNGNSAWYVIETGESFNGQRYQTTQGNFTQWFSSSAFEGAGYQNTPVGAVTHVDEPGESGLEDPSIYFGQWAAGKNFAFCAWNSRHTGLFQAVGDPLVKR